MNRVLITGATGHMGSRVIATLLEKIPASQISVITRKEEKRLELQTKGFLAYLGDYNNISALEKAMIDVETVLLISSGDQGDRMQEHKNVIDIAKKMGVKNIAYTSRALKDRTTLQNKLMQDHFDTEDYIKESGLNYTIFQNGLYMEFLQFFVNKEHMEKGISLPVGDGKVAFTLRADQAEAMANVLLNEDFGNKTYQFTNNETYSFVDVANILSELSGKEIKYTPIELTTFAETLKQRGLPEVVINKMGGFLMDIKNSQESIVTGDLENKLGRKPTTLTEGLKTLFEF